MRAWVEKYVTVLCIELYVQLIWILLEKKMFSINIQHNLQGGKILMWNLLSVGSREILKISLKIRFPAPLLGIPNDPIFSQQPGYIRGKIVNCFHIYSYEYIPTMKLCHILSNLVSITARISPAAGWKHAECPTPPD